jgi:hypothetical protein
MAEGSENKHPQELYSDLDVLVEMVNDAKQDEQVIHRHLESLKAKLDRYIHKEGAHSDA